MGTGYNVIQCNTMFHYSQGSMQIKYQIQSSQIDHLDDPSFIQPIRVHLAYLTRLPILEFTLPI